MRHLKIIIKESRFRKCDRNLKNQLMVKLNGDFNKENEISKKIYEIIKMQKN